MENQPSPQTSEALPEPVADVPVQPKSNGGLVKVLLFAVVLVALSAFAYVAASRYAASQPLLTLPETYIQPESEDTEPALSESDAPSDIEKDFTETTLDEEASFDEIDQDLNAL